MRLPLFVIILLSITTRSTAQTVIGSTIDRNNPRIAKAAGFLAEYIDRFHAKQPIDYSLFWSKEDLSSRRVPDDMVHSISSDEATYRFSRHPVIFYAREYPGYIHLKTNISDIYQDTVTLYAITNHYVFFRADSGRPYFKSEMALNGHRYTTRVNRDITYHFPKTHRFDKKLSDGLLARLRLIERQWDLKPVPLDYYFADSRAGYAAMRGMDYYFNMDDPSPSGISDDSTRTVFCQGLGEGYLHEVLHIYFDSSFPHAALRHALIYYLAGGLGHDFSWMVQRMAGYLKAHPETDLTDAEQLITSDKMIHADHITAGVLLQLIDQREGVAGLRRMMQYTSVDEALQQEFGVSRAGKDKFLKTHIMELSQQPR